MNRSVIAVAGGLLGWSLAAGGQPAATNDPLPAARAVFDKQKQAIESVGKKVRDQAAAAYLQDLREVATHLEKAGDDFGVRPAQEEIKRFERTHALPPEPEPGTPELLVKARSRYQQALSAADGTQAEKMKTLTEQYVAYLAKLRDELTAGAKTAEAERVAAELERVAPSAAGGQDEPGGGKAESELRLPAELQRGLALAYVFAPTNAPRVRDLSGRRRHGTLVGAHRIEDAAAGPAYEFTKSSDVLQTPPVPVGQVWTLAVRARFPLAPQNRPRVLASGGFRQDHVVVDETGLLGAGAGDFVGCGYRVDALRGWHAIVAVGRVSATEFYVDGKPVGVAKAVCAQRLTAIGNSAAGGRPWSGPIASVTVWLRALTRAEVAELGGGECRTDP